MAKITPTTRACQEIPLPESSNWDPGSQQDRRLAWSFRPLVIYLRCLGIDIQLDQDDQSKTRHLFAHLMPIVWLSIIIVCIISDGNYTGTLFQMIIDWTISTTQSIGMYAAFLLASSQHGGQLAESFLTIDRLFPLNQHTYATIRSAAAFSITIVIILVQSSIISSSIQNIVHLIYITSI